METLELDSSNAEAKRGAESLRSNPYPGRGLIIGKSLDGAHIIQIYWIMGRSENSRNRRFIHEGNIVKTDPVDPANVTDPSLIIYNAMREEFGQYVVSNGKQTDSSFCPGTIRAAGFPDGIFRTAMQSWGYEPDEPNYTPRITAIYDPSGRSVKSSVSIAVLSRTVDGTCLRAFFDYDDLPRGFGYCVHTYEGDGNPLPSFARMPFLVPLDKHLSLLPHLYWNLLNKENRVALVMKTIEVKSGESKVTIVNRY